MPLVSTSLLLAIVVACSSAPERTENAPAAETESTTSIETDRGLLPVALPDISRADPQAQEQLRQRYDALQARLADASTSDLALAEAFGDVGKFFIVSEYFDQAEASFNNARQLAPRDMRWPYYLAHVSRFRNDRDTAAVLFEETLALEANHVRAIEWLAAMYLETNRTDEAEAQFQKALSLEPDSTPALYGLGRIALEREEYVRAVERFERALELAPQASILEYPLALAYRGLGNVELAEAHLARRGDVQLQRPDPLLDELDSLLQNAASYEVRGSQALDAGDFEAALVNLRRAAELAPDNATIHLNLGSTLFLSGDAAGAIAEYETTLRLAPDMARAHFALGIINETGTAPDGSGRDDAAAIEHFSNAVRYEPTAVEMRVSLGDALRRTGRAEQVAASLPHYAEALRLDPGVAAAHFGTAMALVSLGRYGEARQWLEDGIDTYPDQPGFPHALARLLAAAPDDSVRDGRRALLLLQPLIGGQQNVTLSETMAMTMAELGDFEEAVAWQRGLIATAEQAGRSDLVAGFRENLALYEAGQPCRTPWRPDDPVLNPRPTTEP